MRIRNELTTDVSEVLNFIQQYRALEKASLTKGYVTIKLLVPNEATQQHLCNQWRWKDRQFGDFFLNIDTKAQIKLLNHWGLYDRADAGYMELTDMKTVIFSAPPVKVSEMVHLVTFFLNHGIESFEPYGKYPGLNLTVPAPEKKRFGNTANWGDYMLSLSSPETVLTQIFNYHPVDKIAESYGPELREIANFAKQKGFDINTQFDELIHAWGKMTAERSKWLLNNKEEMLKTIKAEIDKKSLGTKMKL